VGAGEHGYYDRTTRKVRCAACGPAPTTAAVAAASVEAAGPRTVTPPGPILGLSDVRGVTLGPPRKVAKLVARTGTYTPQQVASIEALLSSVLRSA